MMPTRNDHTNAAAARKGEPADRLVQLAEFMRDALGSAPSSAPKSLPASVRARLAAEQENQRADYERRVRRALAELEGFTLGVDDEPLAAGRIIETIEMFAWRGERYTPGFETLPAKKLALAPIAPVVVTEQQKIERRVRQALHAVAMRFGDALAGRLDPESVRRFLIAASNRAGRGKRIPDPKLTKEYTASKMLAPLGLSGSSKTMRKRDAAHVRPRRRGKKRAGRTRLNRRT
jgi:hypothetical protein